MGYVKMPGMLTPELVKALSSNVYTFEEEQSQEATPAQTWKETLTAVRKSRKTENAKAESKKVLGDIDVCCPRKVKFIFVLNNAVVINVNSIAEEEARPE